ncbi:MAG: AarF/ABC1/UbiB kinase family protein [Anaerolineales bacterium]|nr:AarF/ABC1/UbiB kinase family protein [Anaerolineales bacterium]
MNKPESTAANSLTRRYVRILAFFFFRILQTGWYELVLRRTPLIRSRVQPRDKLYPLLAVQYRDLALQLGGIWIKVGQFLSARQDILPAAVTEKLSGLQDEVCPEPYATVESVIEKEWGIAASKRVASVEAEPLASASLGQVYRAILQGGSEVVLKVQREGIEDIVAVDLRALGVVLHWLGFFRMIRKRVNLDALYQEFSEVISAELDYEQEAVNLERFLDMYAGDPEIHIPQVFPEYSTRRVLVMEDVYAVKVTDMVQIREAGIDPAEVAARIMNAYLRQIFEEDIFHADPHPGNLFVEPIENERWRLVFVDFGMVGRLTEDIRHNLREALLAVVSRDMNRMMAAYQNLGFLLPGADLERIKQAEEELLERIWGKSLREIAEFDLSEAHELAKRYMDLLYELPIQVPVDLILLGRCLGILSGLCSSLDDDFNPFEWLVPYARRWLSDEKEDWFDLLLEQFRIEGRRLLSLPRRLDSVLDNLEAGELVVMARPAPDMARDIEKVAQLGRRILAAVVFCGFLSSAAILYIGGELLLAGALAILAAAALLRVIF